MSRKLNLITATILTLYTSFTLVDTFMLQHSGTAIATSTKQVKTTVKKETSSVKTTATSYEDSHMKIKVTTERVLRSMIRVYCRLPWLIIRMAEIIQKPRHRWRVIIRQYLPLMVIITASATQDMSFETVRCTVIQLLRTRMR